MLTLLTAVLTVAAPPQELYKYLREPDATFSSRIEKEDETGTTIRMTSQTWQGNPWSHQILLRQPKSLAAKGTGILFITGDGPRDGDYRQIAFVSEATGMPVAMLFNIPNQPLWNMREDDLIAHTFQKYLETGDAKWPLLFPMTKSALRAMDAVEAATESSPNPIHRFVVTGASKRGWTTWFVGASGDRRVIGIAPMVYDNLNVTPQMGHQLSQWGKYSEQIEDYTRRGLQQQLATPAGQRLARIIDPYSYRANIRVPTLIVTGGNDRYWTVDAMRLYWDGLRQPKWAKVVPNAGHDLNGGVEAATTIGAFARSLAGEYRMPKIAATNRVVQKLRIGSTIDTNWSAEGLPLEQVAVWKVVSNDTDFRDKKWEKAAVMTLEGPARARGTIRIRLEPNQNAALMTEFRFRAGGRAFTLSTPPEVIRNP